MNRKALVVLLSAAAISAFAIAPAGASAWAPADQATIHPGVQTITEGGQCTSNFVYQDASNVYLGQAAHCSSTGAATETDGCLAESLPLGTPVEIDGATQPGTLVYSSWNEMQANGESNQDICQGNDFAIVRLAAADVSRTNPSIPVWGGPNGIASNTSLGEKVLSYGNSSLRLGVTQLSPKEGVSLGNAGNNGGWTHPVYTVTPGIPGDSGSAFINGNGQAFGVLSVLEALPRPASNGVADLSRALSYMRANDPAFAGIQLANGTEEFSGGNLP
jgi:hypothetical protein